MSDGYNYLPGFSKFLVEEHLEEISLLYMNKIKEINSPLTHPLSGLNENEQFAYWQSNFQDLLLSLSEDRGKNYVDFMVDHWKENKLSLLSKDQSAVKDLLDSFKLRKYTFFKFLDKYSLHSEAQVEVIIEIVDFYNYYIEKLIQVYLEIYHDKLLNEKEYSQSIINNVESGISAFDLESRVTEWNPSMEKTYNVSKKEILGKRIEDFFPGYENSDEAKAFEKALKGERINLNDRKYWLRNGWYEAYLVPLLNKNKKINGVLAISNDITHRKEAELKIQEDSHFIQSIADTSPDVITVYDLYQNRNIYSSKEIYEILGYSPEELNVLKAKGVQGLVEVIHPEDLTVILNFLESYKSYTGTQSRDLEYRIKDKSGNYRWILDRYNVFKRSEDGLPLQIIGVARDNTIRKNAEDEIKQINSELQEANEELVRTEELLKEANNELEERVQQRTAELLEKNKQLSRINSDLDNFIYTASHDLKSPAVNLEGLMNILKTQIIQKINDDDIEVLDMMGTSISKLNKIILDLTEITKAQNDIDGEVEYISFKEVLEDVKSGIYKTIQESGAVIEEAFQIDHIFYNQGNLRSIIYNLLTNAIKYRSDERTLKISIRTFKEGDSIVLCVEDNGLGLSNSQVPKLFSMFKRLHSHVEGTGIGLYIIKRIIENKGGWIDVESKLNKGTIFKVTFSPNALPEIQKQKLV